MPHVVVVGGGLAGLSAAMELCDDHDVTVLERRAIPGGKARTWTDPDFEVFREHSFRVFHATYANTFDTMRRIPTGRGRTVEDDLVRFVSRSDIQATGADLFLRWRQTYQDGQTLDWRERARLAGDGIRLLRLLTASDRRLRAEHAEDTFAELFRERPEGGRGLLYQGLEDMSQIEYSADRVQPDLGVMRNFLDKHFLHGLPGLAWRALRGPTSAVWIDPWVEHLEARGVDIRTNATVDRFGLDAHRPRIQTVGLASGETVPADHVVLAVPSDVALELASDAMRAAAPELDRLGEVRRVWNNGVLVYTSEPIRVVGGYWMWHPWRVAVTTYANRWRAPFDPRAWGVGPVRGRIGDVISYVISDWFADGLHVGKPASACTPDEIYAELCWLGEHDRTVMPEFDPEDHVELETEDGRSVCCLVDPALTYDDGGRIVANEDTLAHFPPGYSLRMPDVTTSIDNLALAGCHCYNAFGCGDSMEGAVETGRRAANAVLAAEDSGRRARVLEGRMRSVTGRALETVRRVDALVHAVTSRLPLP